MKLWSLPLIFGISFALVCIVAQCHGQEGERLDLPVNNAGFDRGTQYWYLSKPELMSHDPQVGRNGPGSLKIVDTTGSSNPFAAQSVRGIQPGATYELKAWVKGLGFVDCEAAVKLEWYNDKGQNTSGIYGRIHTRGSDEWQEVKITAPADWDSTRVSILVRLFGTGVVWFDDVSLTRVAEPPVVRLITGSIGLEPMSPRVVDLDVWIPMKDRASERLSVILTKDGRSLEGWALENPTIKPGPKDTAVYSWKLQLPALNPGEYSLIVKMPEVDPDFEASMTVAVAPEKRKPANLTDTGTILVDGKPFFPIGLYHVSIDRYKLLAQHGFNAVQGVGTSDPDHVLRMLEAAREAGLMVDQALYPGGVVRENLERYKEIIRLRKEHPNLLNWKVIDEPDLRGENMRFEVPEAYREYKKIDPDHPILLTIADKSQYGFWARFCDILQVDPYPLPNQPLTMVSDYVAAAKRVLEPWQNLTAVLQAGWIPGPSPDRPANQPTKAQARSMVYLSLINGAKGIFWYSLSDPGWDLTLTPLWKDFKEINAETAWLGEIVMNGEPIEGMSHTIGEVQYAGWRYQDRVYILATNAGKSQGRISIELGKACTLVEQRYDSTSPRVDGGKLEDVLGPVMSTVYVLCEEGH